MKPRSLAGAVVLLAIYGTLPTSALAQPRPRVDDHHDEHHENDKDVHADHKEPPEVAHKDGRIDKERQNRQTALKDPNAWRANRTKRADDHRKEITSTYGATANTPAARAELATHADRMARLNRVLDLAEQKGDTAMEARAQAAMSAEMTRDEQAMAAIQAGAR